MEASSVGNAASRFKVPNERTLLARETGNPVQDLLFGNRPGEGLPGSQGVQISGRPTIQELENLSAKHNAEFSVVYRLGEGSNGRGGNYFLYSGDIDSVRVPINSDVIWVYHTHPSNTPFASTPDQNILKALKIEGSPQRSSQVIPVGSGNAVRFNATNKAITKTK